MIAYMAAGAAVACFALGWLLRGIFDRAHAEETPEEPRMFISATDTSLFPEKGTILLNGEPVEYTGKTAFGFITPARTARRVVPDVGEPEWDWEIAPTVSLPFDTAELELAIGRRS